MGEDLAVTMLAVSREMEDRGAREPRFHPCFQGVHIKEHSGMSEAVSEQMLQLLVNTHSVMCTSSDKDRTLPFWALVHFKIFSAELSG